MIKPIPLLIALVTMAFAPPSMAASTEKLSNGVPFVIDNVQMAPYAAMAISIHAGAADETAETAGWRQLLASAMMRATTNGEAVLEGAQLTRAAEAAGGQISAQVLDDAIVFTAAGDSATQQDLANLLLNVVLNPRLSEADFAAARRGMLMNLNIAERNDVPDRSPATQALQALLYRDAKSQQPVAYGLQPNGTVDSLTALTDDKAKSLYEKYVNTQSMTISLSGDVNGEALKQIFTTISPSLISMIETNVAYDNLANPPSQTIQMNTPAPWILVGYRIGERIEGTSEDLAALRVLTAALVETSPSLLSQKLLTAQGNEQESLAIQISGQLSIRKNGSELMIAVQSDAAHLAASKAAVLQVVNDLKTRPLSAAQLESAIKYAEGDWATLRDSSAVRAALAGYAQVQGTFPDNQWPAQLKSVTVADVQNAARKYLNHYAEVTVNPINN